jgi:hypothetical protein
MTDFSMQEILSLSIRLIAFSTLLQGIENFLTKSDQLDTHYKKFMLAQSAFCGLCLAFPEVFSVAFLPIIVFSLITSFRWGGNFNGGSDAMTLLSLFCIGVTAFSFYIWGDEKLSLYALCFLAIQSLSSYFFAGVVKIKKRNWRNGNALLQYLRHSSYAVPRLAKDPRISRGVACALALLVISFELSFPAVIFYSASLPYFLLFGVFFHLANFYLFGLNRFFWAWLSTYPAIVFFIQIFNGSN